MYYKNTNNKYKHKSSHTSYNRPSASYVWRVKWWNPNVKNGNYQYKCFRNKQDALIFLSRLQNNINNNVYYDSLEKWFGR